MGGLRVNPLQPPPACACLPPSTIGVNRTPALESSASLAACPALWACFRRMLSSAQARRVVRFWWCHFEGRGSVAGVKHGVLPMRLSARHGWRLFLVPVGFVWCCWPSDWQAGQEQPRRNLQATWRSFSHHSPRWPPMLWQPGDKRTTTRAAGSSWRAWPCGAPGKWCGPSTASR